MSYKKKLITIITLSFIGFGIGVFLSDLCGMRVGIPRCYDIEDIGPSFGFFSIALFFLSLLLLPFREEVFNAWTKFAKWYIPIAFILILITAGTFTGGSWGPSTDLDAEGMSMFTAALFLLISLTIIAVKSYKLRGK